MRQSVFDQRNSNQALLRRFDGFFYCQRHFARFAGAKPDMARFVTDDNQPVSAAAFGRDGTLELFAGKNSFWLRAVQAGADHPVNG